MKGIYVEEIGAQIHHDFDKRSGPRCLHCEERLPLNKIGRKAVMAILSPQDLMNSPHPIQKSILFHETLESG